MPSASTSPSGTTTNKTGKQGSKAKNKRMNSNTSTNLPIEDGANNISEETTKITTVKNDLTTTKSSGSKNTNNSLPNETSANANDTAQTGGSAEVVLRGAFTTFFDHKIRNLEKRKAKLDVYKADQANGKQLNADQLQAVSKYYEVKSQLDFAKETERALREMMDNYFASLKKERSNNAMEAARANLERTKFLLTLAALLHAVGNEDAQQDFVEGVNGATKLTQEQLDVLKELKVTTVDVNLFDDGNLALVADRVTNLMDEKPKVVCGEMTFKEAKSLVSDLSSSEYFKSASGLERNRLKKEQEEKEKVISDAQNVHVFDKSNVEVKEKMREGTYAYASDAQMDLTRMDPAVVAVSYTAPVTTHENAASRFNPGPRTEQQPQPMASHGSAPGDVNLNNLTLKSEEVIDNWTNPPVSTNQEWSSGRDGTAAMSVGLNETEGVEYDYQNRREGDRIQYQNRGRQSSAPGNNGYRGSPSQFQKPAGNLNGKTNDTAYDGRGRYERGDNIYGPKLDSKSAAKAKESGTKEEADKVDFNSKKADKPAPNDSGKVSSQINNIYTKSQFEVLSKDYQAYVTNWRKYTNNPTADLVPYVGGPLWPKDLDIPKTPFLALPGNLQPLIFLDYTFPNSLPYLGIPNGLPYCGNYQIVDKQDGVTQTEPEDDGKADAGGTNDDSDTEAEFNERVRRNRADGEFKAEMALKDIREEQMLQQMQQMAFHGQATNMLGWNTATTRQSIGSSDFALASHPQMAARGISAWNKEYVPPNSDGPNSVAWGANTWNAVDTAANLGMKARSLPGVSAEVRSPWTPAPRFEIKARTLPDVSTRFTGPRGRIGAGDFRGQGDRGRRGGFGNRNDGPRPDGNSYMNQRYPPSMQGPRNGGRGGGQGRGGSSFRGGNGGGMFQ